MMASQFVDGSTLLFPYETAIAIAFLWGAVMLLVRRVPRYGDDGKVFAWETVKISRWQRYVGGVSLLAAGVFLLYCRMTGA